MWERVDFCFPPPTPSLDRAILSPLVVPMCTVPPGTAFEMKVFDEDGGPHMRSIDAFDLFAPSSAHLGGTSARAREIIDTSATLHGLFSLPPSLLLFTDLR